MHLLVSFVVWADSCLALSFSTITIHLNLKQFTVSHKQMLYHQQIVIIKVQVLFSKTVKTIRSQKLLTIENHLQILHGFFVRRFQKLLIDYCVTHWQLFQVVFLIVSPQVAPDFTFLVYIFSVNYLNEFFKGLIRLCMNPSPFLTATLLLFRITFSLF